MTTSLASALYLGLVGHRRLRPRRHSLRYRIFSLLLDLDELDEVDRRLRLFSVDRWNLMSFRPRDHGDGSATPLLEQVRRLLDAAGIVHDNGPVRLLAMPRVLGYAFNPLSLYFCHHRDGRVVAILYEVNNTFGQRHSYLIPVEPEQGDDIRQTADKGFYVSPFIEMAMTYHFRIRPPGEELGVTILETDRDGLLLTATHRASRRDLTDGALLRAFLTHPLVTMKVIGAIHWEALWIWLKGAGLKPRPPAPSHPVTVVHAPASDPAIRDRLVGPLARQIDPAA